MPPAAQPPPGRAQRFRQGIRNATNSFYARASNAVGRADRRTGQALQGWRKDYDKYQEHRERLAAATPAGQTRAYRMSKESRELGNLFFIVLAGLSLGPLVFLSFRGNLPPGLGYTMLIISFVGGFIGLTGGREARPGIGVVVTMFALLTFSYTYTDVVGQALFGFYWPAVQKAGEGTFGPASAAFARAGCTTSASFSCITEGPIACEQARLLCERRASKAEGSDTAVEFGEITFFPKTIEPAQLTSGSVVIENKGDWDATDVSLALKDPTINRVIAGRQETGTIGSSTIVSCVGGELESGKCVYKGTMPKGGKGVAQFSVAWSNLRDPEDRGNFARLDFVVGYHYDVQAAYKVDARSSDALRMLLAGLPLPAGTESIYSGGPVKASFWTSQYVESGKPTLVSASLSNTKEGTATNSVYCIHLPEQGVEFTELDRWRGATTTDTVDCTLEIPGTKVVKCEMGKLRPVGIVSESGNPQDAQTCNFWITVDTGGQPERRLDIVGTASYDYSITKTSKELQFPAVSEQFQG